MVNGTRDDEPPCVGAVPWPPTGPVAITDWPTASELTPKANANDPANNIRRLKVEVK